MTDILPQMITLSEAYIQVRGDRGAMVPPECPMTLPEHTLTYPECLLCLSQPSPALLQIWKRREEDETNQQGA